MRLIEVTYEIRETYKLALQVPDDATIGDVFDIAEVAERDTNFYECAEETGEKKAVITGIVSGNPLDHEYTYFLNERGELDDYHEDGE